MQKFASATNDKDVVFTDDRKPHLDMVRMVCVLVWVIRHGEPLFHTNNIILDQNWSAPLLWLISGICWQQSRTPTWFYIKRLILVFCLGTALNLCAWKIKYPNIHVDMWNVVFQMWFVVGLIFMTCMTSALKVLFDASGEEYVVAFSWAVALPTLLILAALVLHLVGASPTVEIQSDGLRWWLQDSSFSVCRPLVEFALAQMIAACGYAFLPEDGSCSIGWLLLVYIVWTIIVYRHSRIGMEFASMNVFTLGVVVQRWGLYGRLLIGKLIGGYWPLVLLICGWLAVPFVHGISDLEPAENPGIRARWAVITAIMILAFICAGERIHDPFNIFTRFRYLNHWVLFLYTSHVAVHRLLPCPFNWWLLTCSVFPFLYHRNEANRDEMKPVLEGSERVQQV